MKLDVSDALAHPGQEVPFSGSQAIADQEISGVIVRIDDCTVGGSFLSEWQCQEKPILSYDEKDAQWWE